MNRQFWHGKNVFITGHTGFKGSWLCLWLAGCGARITGYSLAPPTTPSLFELADVVSLLHAHHCADVRDGDALYAAMGDSQPDVVIHMAAQPLVRESYQDPAGTYTTNVIGTVNLFEAIRRCPTVRAVVNVTTDKCYENREWVWGYREHEPMGGYDPYSSSKACAELVTAAYRRSFFSAASGEPAIASARAGNVIGGGDWAQDRLIPDIIRAVTEGRPVTIRNPHAIRPWQHVLEPLSGYLLLAQRLYEEGAAFAEAWNFGPLESDAKPVAWIVQQICELWGGNARYELDRGTHPHEASYLKLDCSKARARLKWAPRWDLPTALATIIQWTRGYCAGDDIRTLCQQQIEQWETTSCHQE